MNSNAKKRNGLSARQKPVAPHRKLSTLLWCLIFTSAGMLSGCQGNADGGRKDNAERTASNDSLSKPKVNIQVNRRFDQQGNLIGFDSTYSTLYSSIQGDTAAIDSAMRGFNTFFRKSNPSFFNDHFNPLFLDDSVRYPDFFHHDFFMKQYQLNDAYMKDMIQRMDSIKNQFYNDRIPNALYHKKDTIV